MSDASFESIDQDHRPGEGPDAVLLAGFALEEVAKVRDLLAQAGAPTHRVLRCSTAMLDLPLRDALSLELPGPPVPADQLPRAVILSGLSGAQIHVVIDAWKGAGLARPIWASTTPSNLEFTVKDLLKELLSEQRAMAAQSGSPPPAPKP